jgi:endonuclease-3
MASNNRAAQINKVIKVVKKHYTPAEPVKDRTLLEHLVVACCLENSLAEDAEKVFAVLKSDYFDWNEVRVSSIRELTEVMKPLCDAERSATRVKRVLQSVFETLYSYDLESMKKQNIGLSIKQLEKFNGTSPFTVAYATQHGLGGHSIPITKGLLEAMRIVGVVSDAEAAKRSVPGLERAIPKTKGIEIASLLHQLGVELHRSPFGPTIRKLLLEIDGTCKDRLPKRQTKKAEEPAPAAAAATPSEPAETAPKPAAKKKTGTKAPEEPAAKKKVAPAKKDPPVKKAVRTESKPAALKKKVKTSERPVKKPTNQKLSKKKPR